MASNLKQKALNLGATDFGVSKIRNKRYYVIFNKCNSVCSSNMIG